LNFHERQQIKALFANPATQAQIKTRTGVAVFQFIFIAPKFAFIVSNVFTLQYRK
jgi:hypothetical protein